MFIHCPIHAINNMIKEFQKNYYIQIGKAHNFYNKLISSPLLLTELERIFAILNHSLYDSVINTNREWCFIYLILEQFIEVHVITDALTYSNADIKEIYLKPDNQKVIKKFIDIIKPFYKATLFYPIIFSLFMEVHEQLFIVSYRILIFTFITMKQ